MERRTHSFQLSDTLHRQVLTTLGVVTGVLILISLAGTVSRFGFNHDSLHGWVPMFNLDSESNVPTWFSSSVLMLAGVLAGVIAWVKARCADPFRRHWAGLAAVFLVFSLDETAGMHEMLMVNIRLIRQFHGVFYFSWVIPGLLFLTVAGLSAMKFWRHFTPVFRRRFLVAALVYFGGALGLEMIDGAYADMFGQANVTYALLTTIEESLEMAGVLLFVSMFLRYTHVLALELSVRQAVPDTSERSLDPALAVVYTGSEPAPSKPYVPGRHDQLVYSQSTQRG